ncbi:three-helix bundle dimerization domain-containing protein [Crossiella equi]|uniref:three-helix bundle dimerization domain-containing protein n=1 Tax=Crossiella equi TaxID=130796 RepID=UPI001FD89F3C|nr:hypothetical protein [Crossiella equi]
MDGNLDRVADRLTEEFRDSVPEQVVRGTVREATRDLDGQTAPAAMAEMLHRLAHYRLACRAAEPR